MPDERWLVVGLGNPGPQYAGNRHNVGYMCCDALAAAAGTNLKRDKSRAMTGTATIAGVRVILAKPMSFMNVSGGPVAALRSFSQRWLAPGRADSAYCQQRLPRSGDSRDLKL